MKTALLSMLVALCIAPLSTGLAQTRLEKAVISSGGGHMTNGSTVADVTIGQPVAGMATNGSTVGSFGFWNPLTSIALAVKTFASDDAAISIAPNPASARAELRLMLPMSGELDITLHDVTGRELRTIHRGVEKAGALTLPIDLDGLASGRYYVAVRMPGWLVQRPLTVVR